MQLGAMDQLRRSRLHNLALAAKDVVEGALQKRLTPEQLSSIQAEASRSASALAASQAAGGAGGAATTTQRQGAQPATLGTTLGTSRTTVANTYTQVQAPSSSTQSVSASTSSSASIMYPSGAASTAISTAGRSSSSSIPVPSTSTYAVPVPHTITSSLQNTSRTSSAAPSASATTADRVTSPSSTSLSTGAVVGIVLAVLVGTVALGSLIGYLYRKMTNRGYGKSAPWSKIQDDDITPFHGNGGEKQDSLVDDYYGQNSAPVIRSRRALALARQNAYEDSVPMRPPTEYYGNRAGLGAGSVGVGDYGGYPAMSRNAPDNAYHYGVDASGRPYNGHPGAMPMQDQYSPATATGRVSPPSGRQLLGPGAHPYTNASAVDLMPVPLGRPSAPNSNADLMRHEDFADELPTPMPYNYAEDNYSPRTAKSANEWAGSAVAPNDRSRVSMPVPKAQPRQITPPKGYDTSVPPPSVLPSLSFEPLSPLMGSFAINRQSQALPMYEDDSARQKALYGEVAKAAGVAEPITPRTPGAGLADSTSSAQTYNTASSFSAAEPMPRLPPPPITLTAPGPYQHGRPLSPLEEVPTPASTVPTANAAAPPYTREVNPFDRLPIPSTRTLLGSSPVPSAAYPPPTPGGMSVPGSVTDSPRRWSGPQTPAAARGVGRGTSVYDAEDAYGGI